MAGFTPEKLDELVEMTIEDLSRQRVKDVEKRSRELLKDLGVDDPTEIQLENAKLYVLQQMREGNDGSRA